MKRTRHLYQLTEIGSSFVWSFLFYNVNRIDSGVFGGGQYTKLLDQEQ